MPDSSPPPSAAEFLVLSDEQLLAQCAVHAYRASGPGGQKRNKTSSAVRLHHTPTGLCAQGEEDRSQHVNKRRALRRLRLVLATECIVATAPVDFLASETMQTHRSSGRLVIRQRDPDAPLLFNELLGLFEGTSAQVRTAAECLEISTANLVEVFAADVHVWRKVNQIRRQHGLKPLNMPQ